MYMVAASRLGSIQNPRWCFSDAPFYSTQAAPNELNSNTDPAAYLILLSFDATPKYFNFVYSVLHVACETLD
jgi:hypothetical protein